MENLAPTLRILGNLGGDLLAWDAHKRVKATPSRPSDVQKKPITGPLGLTIWAQVPLENMKILDSETILGGL